MSEPDFMGFLDELLKLREMMAGAVAAFVSDGFTDEQARALVGSEMLGILIAAVEAQTPGGAE